MLDRINKRYTQPADNLFSVKHFSFHYCISGKCSDPCRTSKGQVASSTLQTVVSQPGDTLDEHASVKIYAVFFSLLLTKQLERE